MSRRHSAIKRVIKPDIRYNSVLLAKFINHIMQSGKKALAESIVYQALDRVSDKYSLDAFQVFTESISNIRPELEVTPVRVGGTTYQVPVQVNIVRGNTLSMRWLIAAASNYPGRSMVVKLSEALFDTFNNRGSAIKKRDDMHKMAESNKAFAHFAQRGLSRH
ncbi:30S ribosomal protein S7 [Rickettsia endosymbiont of Cardiosporidium cionae]|uniref:30S ribosomal protein S7 n=1 Tax=Rickettsia endosymbiont of Cardiosporidium cionae TaxID=2777155 RepID=UPI0018949F53|nr:30S ribosomal protein S7 [Rickettsia endosymbiont of Cardiosporidium cionae]KAF8818624.1 30S ribosomal protein S7 [Rickettsia endosymbiont of Cardiosporidium cionae]